MMNYNMEIDEITRGFSDPVGDSQACYRKLLESMSQPGSVRTLDRCPDSNGDLYPATLAIALTLLDFETLLWADPGVDDKSLNFLRFHCGSPFTPHQEKADFALISNLSEFDSFTHFNPGTEESPYESATLIIQLDGFSTGVKRKLTGPGIKGHTDFSPQGLMETFWENRSKQSGIFPMGVDFIFTCDDKIVSIPRTTRICKF